MPLEYQILAAFILDLLLGDPRGMPHPVKIIGRAAIALEAPLRAAIPHPRAAGCLVLLVVLGGTALSAWSFLQLAGWFHPRVADAASILMLYTCFATRDLAEHGQRVYQALAAGDLPAARERVAMLVGRDTASLDEPQIARATVESIAENLVDGVTAPMLFAFVGGPVAAMVYKAINTLDSTFGYRNERYLQFGWASARLDDLANYLPARLTVPFGILAAAVLRLSPRRAWRIVRRDGRRHPSPNSGLSEAMVAGALAIRLGGTNTYAGIPSKRPNLGDPVEPIRKDHIVLTNRLMWLTAVIVIITGIALRAGITQAAS